MPGSAKGFFDQLGTTEEEDDVLSPAEERTSSEQVLWSSGDDEKIVKSCLHARVGDKVGVRGCDCDTIIWKGVPGETEAMQ